MSILRMASFKASYALFLKLVSGAIRWIAISASAMVGGALVGFRMDTIDLLCGETSLNRRISNRFLAYQIPGCQVASVFGTSRRYPVLTTSSLAYQMPYHADWRPHEDTAASAGPAFATIGNLD